MKEFFSHENHAFLPSLSNLGEMRGGKKFDLLTCLDQKLCYTEHVCPLEQECSTFSTLDTIPGDNVPTEDLVVFDNMLEVDLVQVSSEMVLDDTNFPSQGTTDQTAKILDGAFIVQMLSLKLSKTFQDYTDDAYMPYIAQQLNNVHRLDVVRDVYIAENLKTSTRQKRGHGQQRKVSPSAPIPSDWKGFLRNDENKQYIFAFLAKEIEKCKVSGKQIVSTCHENVCSSGDISPGNLAPCTQEEADTHLLLLAADCVKQGHSIVIIRTSDTDVVVLEISLSAAGCQGIVDVIRKRKTLQVYCYP